ncbi:MAG TPA: rhodanese-like domain-containing protein [Kofleriaceae bacterium]|nr:rhodanese-like domain-containing protein [Kofleriaceae bacterium]
MGAARAHPTWARTVIGYCARGSRATKAKQALEAAGYSRVVNGGGYDDLK